VDGGSTDKTQEIVGSYQRLFPNILFTRKETSGDQPSNEGFDRDCNYAVEISTGDYCWLMTDDDLLMPGAIRKILSEMGQDYAVIVASAEVRNTDLTRVLIPRRPDVSQNRVYQPSAWNQFAADVGNHCSFVGAVIIKKQIWLSRNRKKYFGTGFIHVGVIFDEPIAENVLVIATPLVSIRFGNANWSNRSFQIWMFGWPELIWSFPTISVETKRSICPREPWNDFRTLLIERIFGTYAIREYQLFLASRIASPWRRGLAMVIARLPRSPLLFLSYLYRWRRFSKNKMLLFTLNSSWHIRKLKN